MAQKSRYFDSVSYTEADFAEVQNRLLPEGVIRLIGGELAVTAAGGSMTVSVATGEGMIQGFWFKNDASLTLTVPANSSGSTRTDAIFLSLNRVTNIVSLSIVANNPAPTRTLGGDWQMLLATITVPNGASSITQANITDLRGGALCGYTGGGNPDGTVAQPGAPFAGNRLTGFSRDTAGGATGGVRLSINGTGYYYFDTYGATFNTGGPAQAGYVLHTHGGHWMATVPDGGAFQMVMGNNVTVGAQTKQAIIGLGTAASQFLGGSGDLNIYTSLGGGALILGTGVGRALTIGAGKAVSVGPVVGAARFNVIASAVNMGGLVKFYHPNQAHHLDLAVDTSGAYYFQIIDSAGTPATNALVINQGNGYVTIGAANNGTAKLTLSQASPAASEGLGIIYGGGLFRAYVVADGGAILQSATTVLKAHHAINAFTPNTDAATYLGYPGLRWINGFIGCAVIGLSSVDPMTDNSYTLGTGSARWASITAATHFVQQAAGTTANGIQINFGSGTTYMYQDGSAHFHILGPGSTNKMEIIMGYDDRSWRPASDQLGSLGTASFRWSNAYVFGTVFCGGISATGGITTVAGINCGPITSAGIVCSAINTQNNSITMGGGNLNCTGVNATGQIYCEGGYTGIGNVVRPPSPSGVQLGQNGHMWSDLFTTQGWKPGGGTWNNSSCDAKLKYPDKYRPYERGLDTIMQLNPTYYTTTGEYGSIKDAEYVGFRSEEIVDIVPEMVGTHMIRRDPQDESQPEEELYYQDTNNLVYMLVNGMKEQQIQIEGLRGLVSQIEELRGLVQALQERMN